MRILAACSRVIVDVLLQFRDKLGPIFRKRKPGFCAVGAARSYTRYVDENGGQTSLVECARELGRAIDDLGGDTMGG
jgi:hypothetical protein